MQLSKRLRKKDKSKYLHNEAKSEIKPEVTVTLDVHYRREARACQLSLHMGHCIVMGEALLVVVVPQEAPGIGTYSHFKDVSSWQGPEHATSKMPKQRTRRRRRGGSCYMPTRDVTGLPKIDLKTNMVQKVIKVEPCCTSLFYGRTLKNDPLRVLLNIRKPGSFNIPSQSITKDLCLGEDSG